MTKPKPCPFCGGDAVFKGMEYSWNWIDVEIECASCGVSTPRCTASDWETAERKAVEIWNRRVSE